MGFREIADFLVPSWITGGDGGKKTLVTTTMIDASVEHVRLGLEARFPTRAGDSALALIGQDRGIQRGRSETREHYAARLKRWRWPRGHRTRGTAYALLEQISEYFGGLLVRLVTRRGRRYERSVDGAESWTTGSPEVWDGASALPNWGRFWVYIDPGDSGIAEQTDSYAEGNSIGLTGLTLEDAQAIRGLLRGAHPWKPAGVQGEWLIFALDGMSAAVPDATWEHWSYDTGGAQAPTRYTGWRYVSLNPERNNRYGGDPTHFAPEIVLLGEFAGTSGDKTSFPTSVTLPNGTTYSGNLTSFPADVLLFDDGDMLTP
jgi:hypothetical protein